MNALIHSKEMTHHFYSLSLPIFHAVSIALAELFPAGLDFHIQDHIS